MTFNSFQFLIFFPLVSLIHFMIPDRWRWLWLLLTSCYFYMAFIPPYILILFLLIITDYTAAMMMEKSTGTKRKIFLILSILATCSILFIFKYFNFFNNNLQLLAQFLHWNYSLNSLWLILPIGLSFHTFQSLNYVIEVYKGNQKAERHFGIYALYVMFFPQLVAGPIERARNLLPQFYEHHDFDYPRITNGLKLILWGMFQKVVIADRLALVVNQVYNHVDQYEGCSLIIATIFFAFQIYCDFSGYSDIAIGTAQVLGFRLTQNFHRPYFATSISEFWKKWHISLSSWFRDYIYIPLGGNQVPLYRWQINILLTFVLSGLWHGSNWTFITWGMLHGFYYLFSFWTKSFRKKISEALGISRLPLIDRCLKTFLTFLLVCFAWIFFRANSIQDALYIISHLFTGTHRPLVFRPLEVSFIGLKQPEFILAISLIIFLLTIQLWQSTLSKNQYSIREWFSKQPIWVRWGAYLTIAFLIINLGVISQTPFIYFQF